MSAVINTLFFNEGTGDAYFKQLESDGTTLISTVLPGFVFEGLANGYMGATDNDGNHYIVHGDSTSGGIIKLDATGGVVDSTWASDALTLSGINPNLHSIAFHDGKLYVGDTPYATPLTIAVLNLSGTLNSVIHPSMDDGYGVGYISSNGSGTIYLRSGWWYGSTVIEIHGGGNISIPAVQFAEGGIGLHDGNRFGVPFDQSLPVGTSGLVIFDSSGEIARYILDGNSGPGAYEWNRSFGAYRDAEGYLWMGDGSGGNSSQFGLTPLWRVDPATGAGATTPVWVNTPDRSGYAFLGAWWSISVVETVSGPGYGWLINTTAIG